AARGLPLRFHGVGRAADQGGCVLGDASGRRGGWTRCLPRAARTRPGAAAAGQLGRRAGSVRGGRRGAHERGRAGRLSLMGSTGSRLYAGRYAASATSCLALALYDPATVRNATFIRFHALIELIATVRSTSSSSLKLVRAWS